VILLNVLIAVVIATGVVHLIGAATRLTASRVLLASAIIYALPFVATTASIVVEYDNGNAVIADFRYSEGVLITVLVVLVILVINAVTDIRPHRPVSADFVRLLGRRLVLVYGALLVVSAPALLSLATESPRAYRHQRPPPTACRQDRGVAGSW
jgi:hypothetical protein